MEAAEPMDCAMAADGADAADDAAAADGAHHPKTAPAADMDAGAGTVRASAAIQIDGEASSVDALLLLLETLSVDARLYATLNGIDHVVSDAQSLFSLLPLLVAGGGAVEFRTAPKRTSRKRPVDEAPLDEALNEAAPLGSIAPYKRPKAGTVVGLSMSSDGLIIARPDVFEKILKGEHVVALVYDDNSNVHAGVQCAQCGAEPIVGLRSSCQKCDDYDLCPKCFPQRNAFHGGHAFRAFPHPVSTRNLTLGGGEAR
ncbi:hypothetical protein M885DRAFT_567634 [Pelagophyceae sp. CCMP2097]|nr:hypothetical protein M885DRAFT_567634 [Pelagophyceae sp. CCMP2097]